MSKFVCTGDVIRLNDYRPSQLLEEVPPGYYTIGQNIFGFFLQSAEPFTLPEKLYGDIRERAERFLTTYEDRPAGTGVLLSGEKGSGKSLLAKLTAVEAVKRGYPVLLVNNPFVGEEFNRFLQQITQPALILFDEFEKVYPSPEHQQGLLTLLDGTFPTKKLFLLTVNDVWAVNENMRNRPGRLFYSIPYEGLDINFVREYGEDNLKNQDYLEALCQVIYLFHRLSFDILQALVEEMNRYDEDPVTALRFLNARTEKGNAQAHDVFVMDLEGNQLEGTIYPNRAHGDPLEQPQYGFVRRWTVKGTGRRKDKVEAEAIRVVPSQHLVDINYNDGEIVFQTDKHLVLFRRQAPKSFDYSRVLEMRRESPLVLNGSELKPHHEDDLLDIYN